MNKMNIKKFRFVLNELHFDDPDKDTFRILCSKEELEVLRTALSSMISDYEGVDPQTEIDMARSLCDAIDLAQQEQTSSS